MGRHFTKPKSAPQPGYWLRGALALAALLLAFLVFFVFMCLLAGEAHAWEFQWPIRIDNDAPPPPPAAKSKPKQEEEPAPERPAPPHVEAFTFPTYDGGGGDFHEPPAELAPFPDIDTEAIYGVVVRCFPERVPWAIEIDAVAGARYTDNNNSTAVIDSSSNNQFNSLSKYYAGIVARIPIYSASEVNGQRREEYQRRTKLSENVASLVQSMAAMRRAWREIGLYNAATIRTQYRIKTGAAETPEQMGYVEKVAAAYSKLDDAKAQLEGTRLALYGQCREEVADQVNDYLKAVIDDFVRRAKIGQKEAAR